MEDVAVATLRFENGALGVIEATHGRLSRLLEADRDPRLGRLGRAGGRGHHQVGLRQEDARRRGAAEADGRQDARRAAGRPTRRPSATTATPSQFKDVLKAIENGSQPLIDGPEGRRSRRDHPGHLQGGRDRKSGRTAAEIRSGAQGEEEILTGPGAARRAASHQRNLHQPSAGWSVGPYA